MFDEYRKLSLELTSYESLHRAAIHQKSNKLDEQGFQYDTYISYADKEPDSTWVWEKLVPRLKRAGLRIAISGHVPRGYDKQRDGVRRVMGMADAMQLARRTLIVLSPNYLSEQGTDFQVVSQIDPQESVYRLLPVKIAPLDEHLLPKGLSIFGPVDLTHPRGSKREFNSMVAELELPLPWRR
jgi:hypothetical protein